MAVVGILVLQLTGPSRQQVLQGAKTVLDPGAPLPRPDEPWRTDGGLQTHHVILVCAGLLDNRDGHRPIAQVQGVRLNHGIFFGRRSQLWYETVLGYDAVEQTFRQEVHHGHYSTADLSCSSFTFGSWRTPAPGGCHADRWHHPAPPCP